MSQMRIVELSLPAATTAPFESLETARTAPLLPVSLPTGLVLVKSHTLTHPFVSHEMNVLASEQTQTAVVSASFQSSFTILPVKISQTVILRPSQATRILPSLVKSRQFPGFERVRGLCPCFHFQRLIVPYGAPLEKANVSPSGENLTESTSLS